MKISKLSILIILVGILVEPGLAGENSYSSCSHINDTLTTWNINHILPQFDTSLGILNKVEINSTINGSQFFRFENYDSELDYYIDLTTFLRETITMPVGLTGGNMVVLATNGTSFYVDVYDGIPDFQGADSFNITFVGSNSGTRTYTSSSDLAKFIGGISRTYPTRATGTYGFLEAPGVSQAEITTIASSDMCIKFYYIETACISGYKLNEKGQGLSSWTIFIDSTPNGQLDWGEKNATTNATGYWQICGLLPGSYTVCEVGQSGWKSLDPSVCRTVTIADPPLPQRNINFSNSMVACLSGYKMDGCQPGLGLSGWTIKVNDSLGNNWSDLTTSNGRWEICNLTNGTYTVCEAPQSGWAQTSSPACHTVVLQGSNVSGLNFTNRELRCISGYKIIKNTGAGEGGWNITLQNATDSVTKFTGPDGLFEFCNLKPGVYNLTEEIKPSYMAVESVSNPFTLGCEDIINKNFTNLWVIASIHLKKYTNGEDADNVTGPYIPVNGSVTWRYVVTSDSNVPLQNISVTDSMPGVVPVYKSGDNNSDLKLDPDETWIYEATGTAAPGQYENLGNVTGKTPINQTVADEDPSHYFGQNPGISLVKRTNGDDANNATGPYIPVGDTVTWTYLVTNTGNVNLTNVTVTDNVTGVVGTIPLLLPGEIRTLTATGPASSGQYANLGNATGTPPVGDDVSDEDPSHYFGQNPGISLVKSTNGNDANDPTGPGIMENGTVIWTYLVTNTGNVNLTNVSVTDNITGLVGTIPLLLPGENKTLTVNGIASAGQYVNLGNATGTPPVGDDVSDEDLSHYIGQSPSISLIKSTNGDDANNATGPYITVGDTVTWNYLVTNTGDVNLTNVTVTDNITGVVGTIPLLLPGENRTLTATGPASAGQYANLGNATGTPPVGDDVSDEDPSHYFGQNPGISLVKSTNGDDANNETG
ncbi:MAG: choice-of-anchor E domain-containing protein, partial [Methanothrix sp.]|nr:choice-of-anchor E domain-containing protein [Methanothrix sp.]